MPDESGQEQIGDGGYVELVGSPVFLGPAPDWSLEPFRVVGVREAASFLNSRYVSAVTKGRRSMLVAASSEHTRVHGQRTLLSGQALGAVPNVSCGLSRQTRTLS